MVSIALGVIAFLLFVTFQVTGIYAGDSGDLVTAAFLGGVPHPPGYPLYTALGYVVSKIPVATVAWRVTLLSSVPHAIVIGLLYASVRRVTGSVFASVMSGLILLSNYLFFQYSVTPEVFAMFDMFVMLLLYLCIRLDQHFSWRTVWLLSFVLGLSLTHHHVIIFILPAIVFAVYRAYGHRRTDVRAIIVAIACLMAGLLPYLYIPLAARTTAIINWDRAVDLPHFIRLVTRADYGTFISGGAFMPSLYARLLDVKAYAQFLLIDFGVLLLLSILGIWQLFTRRKTLAVTFLLAFVLLGPAFFFYASFPIANRFAIGTYERFFLPSYCIIVLLMGIGTSRLYDSFISRMRASARTRRVYGVLFATVLVLLAGLSLGATVWRFWGIAGDRTAEHLGDDILASVPNRAILLLAYDAPLFITQYVRYAVGVRPDVRLIHVSRINSPDYQRVLRDRFPDITIPTAKDTFMAESFVKENAVSSPVLSNIPFAIGSSWYWVPHGLLYRAVPGTALPPVKSMYADNMALWNAYHDPSSGILSRYPHLMLSDIPDHYVAGILALARTLLRAGMFGESEVLLKRAVAMNADTKGVDALLLLGVTLTYEKKCDEALAAFRTADTLTPVPDERVPLYSSFTMKDCVGDAGKADALFSQYESMKQRQDIPLDQL